MEHFEPSSVPSAESAKTIPDIIFKAKLVLGCYITIDRRRLFSSQTIIAPFPFNNQAAAFFQNGTSARQKYIEGFCFLYWNALESDFYSDSATSTLKILFRDFSLADCIILRIQWHSYLLSFASLMQEKIHWFSFYWFCYIVNKFCCDSDWKIRNCCGTCPYSVSCSSVVNSWSRTRCVLLVHNAVLFKTMRFFPTSLITGRRQFIRRLATPSEYQCSAPPQWVGFP